MTIKTTRTEASVEDFINTFAATPQKKQDGFELLKVMKQHTGYDLLSTEGRHLFICL